MAKIYTTYYGNRPAAKLPQIGVKLSVSVPVWFDSSKINYDWKTVQPDYKTMIAPHKNEEITEEEYTKRYLGQIEKIKDMIASDMAAICSVADSQNLPVFMYCHCGPNKFCHRHILADILSEYGFEIEEYPKASKQSVESTN